MKKLTDAEINEILAKHLDKSDVKEMMVLLDKLNSGEVQLFPALMAIYNYLLGACEHKQYKDEDQKELLCEAIGELGDFIRLVMGI